MLQYNIPILIIYPNINQISHVFDILKCICPQKIYIANIFISNKSSLDKESKFYDLFSWNCIIKSRIFSTSNLDKNIYDSITWFFDNEEGGIILHKDVMLTRSFFNFCAVLLEKYKYTYNVGHISGSNYWNIIRDNNSYFFSALTDSTENFATWRRVWTQIDSQTSKYSASELCDFIVKHPSCTSFKRKWNSIFNLHLKSSWKVRYFLENLLSNRLAIVPNNSMQFANNHKYFEVYNSNYENEISHPFFVYCDTLADILAQEFFFSTPVITANKPESYILLKNNLTFLTQSSSITIPKIIHQIYEDPSGPPDALKKMSQSWTKFHPDWEYKFWNKKLIHDFINEYFSDFIPIYESYPFDVQRWDVIRYLILYQLGGLYVDMDYEALGSIEPLLANSSCCMGMEPKIHAMKHNKNFIVGNAFMASVAKHQYFKEVIDFLSQNADKQLSSEINYQILEMTGPFMVTNIYEKFKKKLDVKLLSADLIAPLTEIEVKMLVKGQYNKIMGERIEKAYAIHYFGGSWHQQISNATK